MLSTIVHDQRQRFVYYQNMTAEDSDVMVSRIAAAVGEPARVRILHSLVDGHARTSTELAMVADVSPSTASAHLNRLRGERLIEVFKQGKHRYYSLAGMEVARALEALNVIAGRPRQKFVPSTPSGLLLARTCYDHIAGKLGVLLHNCFRQNGWLSADRNGNRKAYNMTPAGTEAFTALGIDLGALRQLRRKIAYPCLDWSERQPHVGGALGAALLKLTLKKRWVVQDLDSRALSITHLGRREMKSRLGIDL
jgi:DNA-binding transcriptional ArsR family regulator